MALTSIRRAVLTRPALGLARKAMPRISDTERQALEAGDVWWDAELFSGNPDWDMLLNAPIGELTDREKAFLAGPVEDLCRMLDDWEINWKLRDMPEEAWQFIAQEKFYGMIIPEQYGGLGFSPLAQSEVIRRVASRSTVAAVTVMVPNSLGPGELLLEFGTDEQQKYWLPRLADGREIPCFGLTSPSAGSDASAIEDTGVITRGTFNGEEVLGIRLNWHKRYIALAPVATVLGLAFKLYDPDHLIGEEEDLGITVALVPTDLDGVDIGRRHIASFQMFQVGPTWGHDVFIPLENIIGGREQAGQGWKMLMSALAAGRGISLPSLSAAGAAMAARMTGAYARVREQFGIPIGKFEGVQERLARIAANAYRLDAARRLTCAAVEEVGSPSVISALVKTHTTYRLRDVASDAMDVHAGKTIIEGPLNYLSGMYRGAPVGITVEGANILTRNLIIFGQGAIRCHPYLLKEIFALEEPDREKALEAFDEAFWGHAGHLCKTLWRAWLRSWSAGLLSPAPRDPDEREVAAFYRQLSRYSAVFAACADFALLTLGGALKKKELLSGRFADILTELYMMSAVLKRWRDEGHHQDDLPLVEYNIRSSLKAIVESIEGILTNLPVRPVAWLLKFIIHPLGTRIGHPSDRLTRRCAEILLEPSDTRERLTSGIERGHGDDGVARVERAFDLVVEADPIRRRLREHDVSDRSEAKKRGIISAEEADLLERMDEAVAKAIEEDHFDPEELRATVQAEGGA
jgi:acyl-CoA dehydrogenase